MNPLKIIHNPPYRPIMGGLFKMGDTLGFPLEDSILECEKLGVAPGIPAFVCDAVLSGWSIERAIDRVNTAWKELGRGALPDEVLLGLIISLVEPKKYATL